MVLVGVPAEPHPCPSVVQPDLPPQSIAGSLIGGIAETQEMLDFCAEQGIVSDIEMIPIQDIEEAYERMLKSDVKYRFVIDMSSLSRPLRRAGSRRVKAFCRECPQDRARSRIRPTSACQRG